MDIFVFIYLIKCIKGFVSGGLIILVGVMVIYVLPSLACDDVMVSFDWFSMMTSHSKDGWP